MCAPLSLALSLGGLSLSLKQGAFVQSLNHANDSQTILITRRCQKRNAIVTKRNLPPFNFLNASTPCTGKCGGPKETPN
jgi:hypothetical protein